MKQCKFLDTESNEIHGGIIDDSGNIICGCCGGLIECDDIGETEGCIARIIEVYDTWIDLTVEICGGKEFCTFTAFAYEDDGITTHDLSTYYDKAYAIEFAKMRGWDEVVNDVTGEIVWSR